MTLINFVLEKPNFIFFLAMEIFWIICRVGSWKGRLKKGKKNIWKKNISSNLRCVFLFLLLLFVVLKYHYRLLQLCQIEMKISYWHKTSKEMQKYLLSKGTGGDCMKRTYMASLCRNGGVLRLKKGSPHVFESKSTHPLSGPTYISTSTFFWY